MRYISTAACGNEGGAEEGHKSVTENLSTVGANDMLVIFYDGRLPPKEREKETLSLLY